jgi:hypothetical protein
MSRVKTEATVLGVERARRSVAVRVTSAITRARNQVLAGIGSSEVVVFVQSCVVVDVLRGPRVSEPDGCHDGDGGGRVRDVPLG